MDYDDNDFQSQSFQLAVEENIKFSPGSHSYSLPKFDLDYSLQTHLRFDSLVESEVLLGIRSQEENHWIEDFSRESSGLEFSSGAPESCSISRRNNVWSEATSSESVDLLLKSVGQDDRIMGQAKIEESDACDGLDSLTNQMDPNLNKDNFSLPETGNATCVGSISTLDVTIEQYPVLGKDVVDQQSQIDSASQLEEGKFFDDKSERSKSLGDSSIPECEQVRIPPDSVQSFVSDGELNSDVLQGDGALEQDIAEAVEDYQVLSKVMDVQVCEWHTDNAEAVGDHQVLNKVMDVQACEWHTDNTDVNNVGNICSLVQKADSTVQATEVRSHAIFTTDSVEISDYEHITSSKDTHMVDPFVGSSQEASVLIAGDNISVAQSTDFSGGATEIHSVPIAHFSDQTVPGHCNDEPVVKQGVSSENVSHQLDGGISLSSTEELQEKTICEGHGNENADDQFPSSSFVREVCSSTDVTHDSQSSKDRKDRDVSVGVHCAEVCHTSSLLVESRPRCDLLIIEDAPCGVWISRPDVYVVEKENEGLPSCSDIESAGAVFEIAIMGSDNIADGIQNLIQGTSIANDEAYQQEGLSSSSHANSCSLVAREEEIVTRSSIVPRNLDAKERSQVSTEQFPCSKPEDGEACDTAKELHPEIVGQSSSSAVISGKICQNEHGSDVADIDVQQQCSERLKESLVIQDVALKDDGPAEVHSEYNIEGVPIEVEGTRSCHEKTQRHPPPSLRESDHDISLKVLEDYETSETNSGLRTARESTERGVMPSPALPHTLPPSLGDSTCDTYPENLEAGASKSDNSLRSPITSLQGIPLNVGGIVGSVAKYDAEGHVLEAESSSLNFTEPNCGSPTTISCSEASQSEKDQLKGIMVSLSAIDSGSLEQETNKIIHTVVDPKDSDAFEDDRSFTFKVSSVEELSEKETVSGWAPFPNVQPYKTSRAVGSSCVSPFGSCGIDSKMLEGSGNPRTSGETNMSQSSMCTSVGETRPLSGKTIEKETAEGKPQNNVVLDGGKEYQDKLRRSSDSNTAVPRSIDQVNFFDVSPVHDHKGNIAAEVSRRFSFGANSMENLSEKGTCHRWKPVFSVQPYESPQTVGASSPATPFIKQIDANELQKISRESRPRVAGGMSARRSYKSNAVDKTQSLAGKAADKEKAKGGKTPRESISRKHTKAGSNNSISASPTSPGTMTQVLHRGEARSLGSTEGSSTKSCVVTTVQTSNLPDLNSSVSSYLLFQQPFTASQQVQLRAQIFVYGSIIQGTVPDEACMEAAFGESDGGRSAWENVWRVTVERFHNQKSPLNVKTPLHPHNDSRSTETMNQTVHRSEALCTPNTPFSSPTWSVPSSCRDGLMSMTMPKGPLADSSKTFIPLQPYQYSPARQYLGNTSPWPTPVPSPGTWVVTPQSAALSSVHHPTLPISETVRVTSVRESVPQSLGMQHAPPNLFIHMGSPLSGSVSRPLLMDAERTTISPSKPTNAESKPRKRRRNVASEEQGQISPIVQPWRDLVPVSAQLPISATPTTTTSVLNAASGGLLSGNLPGQISSLVQSRKDPVFVSAQSPRSVTPTTTTSAVSIAAGSLVSGSSLVPSMHRQIVLGGATEQRVWVSEEMSGKIELAKREAEDAAGLAATAVGHCQNIWTQLAVQKNSGAVSEIEAKLGSSAVAIAAAASIAKAAAAVAKVASDAALQAKLMADEALCTSKSLNLIPETSFQEDVHNLGRVTPSSILKGRDKISNADSVLGVVREAARKRVDSASAAAKRAENLGALLKAAEMTAEAVSQAGTIIAMGEPLPFTITELVDAGPEGYWKVQQKPLQLVNSSHLRTQETYKEGSGGSVEQLNEKLLDKNEINQIVNQGKVLSGEELSRDSAENKIFLVKDVQWGSVLSSGKGLEEQKGCAEYTLSKTIGVVPESQVVAENASLDIPNDGCRVHLRASNEDKIDEGSLLEVRSEEEGLGMVWFLAKVLSLKDGKASVSYIEHAGDEGSSQPTEWVPLYEKGDDAPRIRIPHPLSVVKHKGTKKRSRAARGDYAWSVGDKVDAWIRNGWWEGIITEKRKDDESYLTVKFSAQRESSVVRAWNLRPSLIWENGKWIEWGRPMESNCLSHERNPPKKSRVESETDPAVEAKGKDTMTKLPVIKELEKSEPLKPLMLSAKEKVFNVGKKITEGKHVDAFGTKHTGLQKEGSRVVFGIPKPGKKRKFMDVSRHYVSDEANKLREGSDSAKFTKFLVPQESASRGWKNTSKAGLKGKRIAEPNKKPEGQELLLNIASNSISHIKKSPYVAADLQSKGRAAPLGVKSVQNNVKRDGQSFMGNVMPNAAEPRRSVRRIQPTSRLLEGLQSSLIASKIPTASHGKGTKTQQKSLKGRTHG